MNFDIRLSTDFFQHPKTRLLQKRLGAKGVLSLQKLWIWAAQNRPNGVFGAQSCEYIAMAADWAGDCQKFVDTLLELRWLDVDVDGSYSLHNWEHRQPYAKNAEERRAKAQKEADEKAAQVSEARRDAANRRWGKDKPSNRGNQTASNNPGNLACKQDANSMQTDANAMQTPDANSMQTDANENLHDANAMQKNANGCYQYHNHNQRDLDLSPLPPHTSQPAADASGECVFEQEASLPEPPAYLDAVPLPEDEQPAPECGPLPEEPAVSGESALAPDTVLKPEQAPKPDKPKKKRTDYRRDDWRQWWGRYPNQDAEAAVLAAWEKKCRDGTLPPQDVLMAALDWQIEEWRTSNFQYTPKGTRYLREQRWNDKPKPFRRPLYGPQLPSSYGSAYGQPFSKADEMSYVVEKNRIVGAQVLAEMAAEDRAREAQNAANQF